MMMFAHCSVRFSRLRIVAARLLVTVPLLGAGICSQALAQSQECIELGKKVTGRQTVIEQINGFQKKQPTADAACAAFTRLQQLTVDAIKGIERDGAWCHVPGEILPSLQAQAPQIAEAKKNSCGAAEQQRKLQQGDPKTANPLSGGDSVIGGQIKMPKGAL